MHAPHLRTRTCRALLAVLAALAATSGLLATTTAPASAGQVGVTIGIQGAGSVSVVEGSIEDGVPTTCQRHANQDHRVVAWCDRMRNAEVLEAWVWLRATAAFSPAGHWRFEGWSGCDQLRERDGATECAVHSGAFSSDERRPIARFRDVVAPEVFGAIASPVADQDLTFRFLFQATDGDTACRVEGTTSWFRCVSGHPVQVTEGRHVFQVSATDPSGNTGTASAEVVAVDTRISNGPAAQGNDPTPTFGIHTIAGTAMWCSLDGSDWTACGTGTDVTYEPTVADGNHHLLVQARSGTWVDPVPAEWRWTTDTVAPSTTITATIDGTTADFRLTSDDAVAHECRMDRPSVAGDWFSCNGGLLRFLELGNGVHTFRARSTDAAGNVESPAASHRFTVDTTSPTPDPDPDPVPVPVPVPGDSTPPETTVLSGPAGFVLDPTATFALGSESGATFRCTLDGVAVACGAGFTVPDLHSGTHVLTAAAVDAAGNVDPTPATRAWTVPVGARELGRGRGWKLRRSPGAYAGSRLEATRRGSVLARKVTGARGVALVVGKGRGHGTVRVYAGSRLLRTVRLSGPRTASRVLVPVTTFSTPFSGRVRLVLTTRGRPVHIEGLGVATG